MLKRIINMKVLPGEPLDGSGKVCIHLFVQDDRGAFVEGHVIHTVTSEEEPGKREFVAKPARGRLACDPRRTVAAVVHNGVTTITPRTDDPRAVTCPKCKASAGYAKAMELIAAGEAGR